MAVQCPGCQRSFKGTSGMQQHRPHCSLWHDKMAEYGRKLKQKEERSEASKLARQQGRDVGEERHAASPERDNEAGPDAAAPQESFVPPPTSSGRVRRFPRHFVDFLPSLPTGLPHLPPRPQRAPPSPVIPERERTPDAPDDDDPPVLYETEPNDFGVYRVYTSEPTHDPESLHGLGSLYDGPGLVASDTDSPARSWWSGIGSDYAPFRNASVFRLMRWVHNGNNTKSVSQINELVNDVILAEGFNAEDLRGDGTSGKFSTQRENERLDAYEGSEDVDDGPGFSTQDGWKEGTVVLHLPADGVHNASEEAAPTLEIEGLWYRSVVDVIKSAFAEASAEYFHLQPFKLYWRNPDDDNAPPVRLISELYNSDAFLEEHEKIMAQSQEPGCGLERVVAAIMLWSDSTHLASFGNASLWPVYLYFGNLSKYWRAKPTSFAAHHLAYLPSLPDTVQDAYTAIFGESASAGTLTFLKRDLMQSIWMLLLDDDFIHAYTHGLEIKCVDGVVRRIYPRLFTYSADYPEKALLATIKSLGRCPCPDCTTEMSQISGMGTKLDMKRRRDKARQDGEARQWGVNQARVRIYQFGYRVNGPQIERMLGPGSAVPNRNAFSSRLFKYGLNFYSMFVPDLMHEFELGVWKSIFTHLIRILYANGGDGIQTLNARYRQVPTFGRGTIRRFSSNASAMKKLAARDFEDLLQCAIPVFEGLLPPPHDATVSDFLFVLATWHAYAKLRLHTEHTLNSLEQATSALGKVVRHFAKTTSDTFRTYDLPHEEAARGRRAAALLSRSGQKAKTNGAKQRYLNLSTYKFHRLGDYVQSILRFGTSDNFTTQVGELEHRRVKRFYARTNKHNFTQQVTLHQRRERMLRNIQSRIDANKHMEPSRVPVAMAGHDVEEPLPCTQPTQHYHISDSTRVYDHLATWLREIGGDPAVKNFVPHLKDHLLARLRGQAFEGDEHEFSDEDRNTISFVYNRIYRHKVMRLNYTTRRSQDSVNIQTHSDVMVFAHEDDNDNANAHPYWYARVMAIFHADVQCRNPESRAVDTQHMDFLWVRWFGRDLDYCSGFEVRRLPRIGFVPSSNESAFGFLSPDAVLRATHLIAGFAHGTTRDLLPGESIARQQSGDHTDWQYYYVNIFVDRDMFMRYSDEGIGHKSTRRALGNSQLGDSPDLRYDIDESEWLDENDVFIVTQDNREQQSAEHSEDEGEDAESQDSDDIGVSGGEIEEEGSGGEDDVDEHDAL